MRLAILSDIHANLSALTSVLAFLDTNEVDEIYCLGDVVGYGPFPNECADLVIKRCTATVMGNHESGLLGKTPLDQFNKPGQKALRWTEKQITTQHLTYLSSLPLVTVEHGLTFVHASPSRPAEWTYVLTLTEVQESFYAFSTQICFIGHTHIPIVVGEDLSIDAFRQGSRFLINVGSVGQPRDGNPKTSFGLLDTEAWSYRLIRLQYDVHETANAIIKRGLPKVLARRLLDGH
ncbi:MAG: metallophosphoesterase family protein [Ignavibacteria bacterium]|nr:metallophosphoesterase family protein [Ignavibacteria bacterium]